mmetsp:Transcript_26986/g.86768  ORF Transcript_26986/g.86768 Transcript_26986/m.86768 type:complete len:195 (-) Transcript_26986:172-756(-)|eukprot:CAMPEP_0196788198 /NCGR_PEP_ID=MMETSP1104-20130614/24447_1 /TAXON_ID=33652 /ORGANISM="Cafeteria sp., Strain Caron Lab Isolate" /LENGTH=194 /DNA_ID=CAMNT_0042158541 /DNA_START=88 /DNA_END=672 /DNA_ORIENTATION=+
MSATVFVKNLKWEATDESLSDFFSSYGTVVKAEVQRMPAGRSKGWALVTFSNAAEAQAAADGANGAVHEGRTITVRLDRGDKPAPRESGGAAEGGARRPRQRKRPEPNMAANDGTHLFVGNIPWATTEEELRAAFAPYNPVSVEVLTARSGRSLGRATVKVSTAANASAAVAALNGTAMGDRSMVVKLDEFVGQ